MMRIRIIAALAVIAAAPSLSGCAHTRDSGRDQARRTPAVW
jgi:hypothetical protein